MVEMAILGLLQEAPLHGYELRKQLRARLCGRRWVSYGSLYPTLRRLTTEGFIVEEPAGPRSRRVYRITEAGKARFARLISESGPHAWDDECFGVHVAFFARTPAEARMRILEGRRRAVEERRDGLVAALARAGDKIDRYTRELHRVGLETSETEVRWLSRLIATEQAEQRAAFGGGEERA